MEPSGTSGPVGRVARRRAPLAAVAVALAAGIIAGRYLKLPVLFWAVFGGAFLVIAAMIFRRKHLHALTCAAVAAAIIAIGAAHLRVTYFATGDDHVVTYTSETPILATLRGRIVTSPMRFTDTTALGYRRPDRVGFILQAKQLRSSTGYLPVSGLLRVSIVEPIEQLAAGQDVELVGWRGRLQRRSNPGQFDRAAAARRNHTLASMNVPAPDGATILAGSEQGWPGRIYWNLRSAIRQHLAGLGSRDDRRLLSALIIGERHPALAKLNRTMVRAGIVHFLSISGLHLGVFLGFLYLLCRLCMLTPRRSAALVLLVLTGYVLLAEPRVPLLRSAIMAAALCIATISRRRNVSLNALAAGAIVLLAIDPLQLFSPGFQLSFAIVVGLITLRGPARRLLFGRWLRRRGLVVFRTDQRFRRRLEYLAVRWLMNAVVIALIAYAMAAPLVAYHFGLFSPYAAVLSVVLFPLVAAVLVPGYVSIALFWPLPGLAYAIGRAASAAAEALARTIEALGHLPAVAFELRPLHVGWVVLCYVVLVLIVLSRRVAFGRLTAAAAAIALCLWTAALQLPAGPPAAAELHLLAVGAGQSAILRTPTGKTFLLDAGTASGFDAYQQVIGPFLRSKRLPAPRQAFISHANTDHFNALLPLIRKGQLRRVYLNDYFGLDASGPSLAESPVAEFMRALAVAGVEIVRLRAGASVQLDTRTKVEVAWPPETKRDDLSVNDTSLVLRVICDETAVLLTGDLNPIGQQELAGRPQLIATDVLVVPHHGGWEDTLPDFFDAANPTVALISAAHEPYIITDLATTAAKPVDLHQAEFYSRLRNNCRYYATPRNGWICIRFGHGKIDVETMH